MMLFGQSDEGMELRQTKFNACKSENQACELQVLTAYGPVLFCYALLSCSLICPGLSCPVLPRPCPVLLSYQRYPVLSLFCSVCPVLFLSC
jgi:hypothetical protein